MSRTYEKIIKLFEVKMNSVERVNVLIVFNCDIGIF